MKNRHVVLTNESEVERILNLVKGIESIIFDSDGVVTNNQVLEGFTDFKPRWRSHYDGQGISLLRAIGIKICFITNEKDEAARAIIGLVDRWNHLPSTPFWGEVKLCLGCGGELKVREGEKWFSQQGLSGWGRCAVMGDDLVDVPMLKKASLKVAPISADYVVRDMADIVSRRAGGFGAIRDLANFILEVRGIDPTSLPTQ